MMIIKTYDELVKMKTFEERFKYLMMPGQVGRATFGSERWLNQAFYSSKQEWKRIRHKIILRDDGCDLGIPGREIKDKRDIRIHHINPISINDIRNGSPKLLDPNNLICCSFKTHQAIHYTGLKGITRDYEERAPYDTCPWRQ